MSARSEFQSRMAGTGPSEISAIVSHLEEVKLLADHTFAEGKRAAIRRLFSRGSELATAIDELALKVGDVAMRGRGGRILKDGQLGGRWSWDGIEKRRVDITMEKMIKMFINFSYQMEKGVETWFMNKKKMVRSTGHLARQLARLAKALREGGCAVSVPRQERLAILATRWSRVVAVWGDYDYF